MKIYIYLLVWIKYLHQMIRHLGIFLNEYKYDRGYIALNVIFCFDSIKKNKIDYSYVALCMAWRTYNLLHIFLPSGEAQPTIHQVRPATSVM